MNRKSILLGTIFLATTLMVVAGTFVFTGWSLQTDRQHAHAAASDPKPGDIVTVLGQQIGPEQEDIAGHKVFFETSGTINVPAGSKVLLARDKDLTKGPTDLRVYVDDIMTITTDYGSFTYDSSGGCKDAHQYLNADLADAQQARLSALFKAGVNHFRVELKDGCGDGKSKNSKFSTALFLIPVALVQCNLHDGNGKNFSVTLTPSDINKLVADWSAGGFSAADIRANPCAYKQLAVGSPNGREGTTR